MKVVNDQTNDWDAHLDPILFGYRVNQQLSTKQSPFELLYGVKAKLPVDLNADVDDDNGADAADETSVQEARVERCLLYTSPSPRDGLLSRMPSSA